MVAHADLRMGDIARLRLRLGALVREICWQADQAMETDCLLGKKRNMAGVATDNQGSCETNSSSQFPPGGIASSGHLLTGHDQSTSILGFFPPPSPCETEPGSTPSPGCHPEMVNPLQPPPARASFAGHFQRTTPLPRSSSCHHTGYSPCINPQHIHDHSKNETRDALIYMMMNKLKRTSKPEKPRHLVKNSLSVNKSTLKKRPSGLAKFKKCTREISPTCACDMCFVEGYQGRPGDWNWFPEQDIDNDMEQCRRKLASTSANESDTVSEKDIEVKLHSCTASRPPTPGLTRKFKAAHSVCLDSSGENNSADSDSNDESDVFTSSNVPATEEHFSVQWPSDTSISRSCLPLSQPPLEHTLSCHDSHHTGNLRRDQVGRDKLKSRKVRFSPIWHPIRLGQSGMPLSPSHMQMNDTKPQCTPPPLGFHPCPPSAAPPSRPPFWETLLCEESCAFKSLFAQDQQASTEEVTKTSSASGAQSDKRRESSGDFRPSNASGTDDSHQESNDENSIQHSPLESWELWHRGMDEITGSSSI